jgi:tetratricopeptide (TPR) repeat protein
MLLLLETGLSLAGYGYRWRLFLPVKDFPTLGSNVEFGQRFFPRAIARKPLLVQFREDKPPDTYRIFLLGASAAAGIPEPIVGFGQILDVMLEDCFPEADFETVNCSLTAINSHVVLPIARECAGYDPDLFVIYLGNNEVIGPFNVGSSEERRQAGLGRIRRTIASRKTKIGQLVQGLGEARISDELMKSWGGMAMYTENLLAVDDPALDLVYDNYRQNLEDMIRAIAPTGAGVLLSTVSVNIRDNAPFASVPRPDLSGERQEAFAGLLRAADTAAAAGDTVAAVDLYRQALDIDDRHADLHFRLGRSLLARGELDEAREHLQTALDLDGLRFRAGTGTNSVVRDVAAESDYSELRLFDAQKLVDEWCAARGTLPGDDLFFEHVHFNFAGNYLMARLLFEQVVPLLPAELKRGGAQTPAPPGPEQCAAALAMTPWSEYNMVSQMYVMVKQPPFTGQSSQRETLAKMAGRLESLKGQASGSDPEDFVRAYRSALVRRSDDLMLRFGFAKLLQELGRPGLARQESDFIQKRLPVEVFGAAP